LERFRYFESGNACFYLPSLFWSIITEPKRFLEQYFLLEWKLDAGVYLNVMESILCYFVGMATQWNKAYTGAVGIYFEMAHVLTCSIIFFRAGVANPLYSFRVALQTGLENLD